MIARHFISAKLIHLLLQNNDKTSLFLTHSQNKDKVKADQTRQAPWTFSLRHYIAKAQKQSKITRKKGHMAQPLERPSYAVG